MTRAGYPSWYSRETRRPIRGAIALKQIVMPGLRLQTNHSFCFLLYQHFDLGLVSTVNRK